MLQDTRVPETKEKKSKGAFLWLFQVQAGVPPVHKLM